MRGVNRDEISMHGENVGDQYTGRRFLLVAFERRRPLDRNRFAADNIEKELGTILPKCERRFGSVFIAVDTDSKSFRQDQVHEAKRIRQWRRKVLSSTN